MPDIYVEEVAFRLRNGTEGRGTAVEVTTLDSKFGSLLDDVTVSLIEDGEPILWVVPGYSLSRDSYARVCAAIGVEP